MKLIGINTVGFWHIRLFSKVTGHPDGCWNWTGCKNKEGYGHVKMNGVVMLAHRAAFLIVNGFLPADKLVCHHCDNTSCINPQHFFLGTNADNKADSVRKNRHRWYLGGNKKRVEVVA
jgi:hypothetical protein